MFKISLLLASAIAVLSAAECPDGTFQIGEAGLRVSASRAPPYTAHGSIEECKTSCSSNVNCQAFTYNEDLATPAVCFLYTSSTPNQQPSYPAGDPYANAITCELGFQCPSGYTAIGRGEYISGTPLQRFSGMVDINECTSRCNSNPGCGVFKFDDNPAICNLYPEGTSISGDVHPSSSYSNMVVCEQDASQTSCPAGSSLIAEGQWPAGYITMIDGIASIELCQQKCAIDYRARGCESFLYDNDGHRGAHCALFESTKVGGSFRSPDPRVDSILCELGGDLCPAGTSLIGEGQYLKSARIFTTYGITIELCRDLCIDNANCRSFLYDDDAGGRTLCWHHSTDDSKLVGDYHESYALGDSRLCSVVSCPDGTTQIGGVGTRYPYLGGGYGATFTECAETCARTSQCVGISYDFDSSSYNGSPSLCFLLSSTTSTSQFYGNQMDTISCAVPSGYSSAQSNGLFNLDSVAITNGNGDSTAISVYIIYGVIGLVLVNIICLIINCWNKKRGNSKRYKVVSMRSDEEITDV